MTPPAEKNAFRESPRPHGLHEPGSLVPETEARTTSDPCPETPECELKLIETGIPDVVVIEPDVLGDERGFFMECWHAERFRRAGIDARFVQDNHSRSSHGVLRGLHYQIRRPQGKLVRVVSGEVFDVMVDLRHSSPTFGKWAGVTLSGANHRIIWIPEGFAHGFLVTGDHADLLYKCTDYYAPEHDRAIRWDDPTIGIEWPLALGEIPCLSAKDRIARTFGEAQVYE